MDTQATLKQPTRSGKLVVGMPNVRTKKKAKAPVCDGRCIRAKKCIKCLRKRATQAVERTARLQERHSKQAETSVVQTHRKMEAIDANKQGADEEEDKVEYFDDWGPGRLRATPERLAFTPTPPSSARK